MFYDSGAVYHISPLIETSFTEVWQTSNQLLRAVLSDVKVTEYQAGCKALGLINKMITCPLWCVLESQDISILDMNEKLVPGTTDWYNVKTMEKMKLNLLVDIDKGDLEILN